MIIYNVTIKVEHGAAGDWVQWMKEEHIPDLMRTGLFEDARLCGLLEHEEEDGKTYVAQYFCKSRKEYDAYIDTYAVAMREKAFKAFGNKFVAFRTLMEVL